MKISDALVILARLRELHGDVEVAADCPFCLRSFPCAVIETGPVVAKLKGQA